MAPPLNPNGSGPALQTLEEISEEAAHPETNPEITGTNTATNTGTNTATNTHTQQGSQVANPTVPGLPNPWAAPSVLPGSQYRVSHYVQIPGFGSWPVEERIE